MNINQHAKLLRIFIGESDKYKGKPLYEHIVFSAREYGLAGVTVLKGIMGFGGNSIIHTAKLLTLSEDLPLVIEIADNEEKIEKFIPVINSLFESANAGGLITLEKVEIIKYSASK